jgi:hypothetical protein
MKKFLVFTLLLANSSTISFGCGFYPYGEEIRMCFLNNSHFNCYSFNGFEYSSRYYHLENPYRVEDIKPNDKLWFEFCKQNVNLKDILEAVYEISAKDFTATNKNGMIQYLFQNQKFEAIDYLKFAKSCEIANMFYSDPWERTENVELKIIRNKIDFALEKAINSNNEQIQLRYKFLAIRLAFYGGRKNEVIKIYNSIPTNNKLSILNYWSMYFRSKVEENKALQSFYSSQVFANAPDKRFPIFNSFDKSIDIKSILKYAKNNDERANVYAFAAAQKHDKALNFLKKAYQLNPNSKFNFYLILREVNKIEDWVFTPYYTNFNPSISDNNYYEKTFSYNALKNRISKDRIYANEVLNFLNSIKKSDKQIEICKAQLSFISQNHIICNKIVNRLEKKIAPKDSLYEELEIIKALNLTANQKINKAKILDYVQTILLKNKTNNKFIFAIARELEYLGNNTDAAFLISKITDTDNYSLAWKSKKYKKGSYRDYFYDYFGYVDVLYTPQQLESVIRKIDFKNSSDFDEWLKSSLKFEKSKLYDLLGTKYIRQNNLSKALLNFKKTEEKYWNNNYSLWKVNNYSGNYFDSNPFFTLKYTVDFIKEKENFYLTKATVTQKLIDYIDRANSPIEKNRDYYYFLVGNCYKNMTINGNSWMMRRFNISSYDVEPFPEDQKEFTNGFLAKKYYRLAYKYAKTKKFKSLCLWLAEDYSKLKKVSNDEYFELSDKNCYAFEDYFRSRR